MPAPDDLNAIPPIGSGIGPSMPESWPDRPAFANFRVVTVETADGRRVHYYDWPVETDAGDSTDRDSSGADATRQARPDDGV